MKFSLYFSITSLDVPWCEIIFILCLWYSLGPFSLGIYVFEFWTIVLNFFTDFFFTFVFSVPYFWNIDIWLLGILDWSLILFSPNFFLSWWSTFREIKKLSLPTDCLISTLVLLIFKVFLWSSWF